MAWDHGTIRVAAERRNAIERAIVKDSSPGYPWVMLGADNSELLETNKGLLWQSVTDRMTYQRDNFDEIMKMGPEELIKNGVCDPVKVFIKKEPHSHKKISTGFLRLIASISTEDQIITRLLATRQNKLEIANWKTCPSKPGMGLNDEGIDALIANAEVILDHGLIMATDVSSWDWTVQDWELKADAEARIKLAGVSRDSTVGKLLRIHAHCIANSVYVTSDGAMFAQVIPGGQLSGDYNTSSTNSRMRVLASLAARYRVDPSLLETWKKLVLVVSMGDDTFELFVQGLENGLEELGHIVKEVRVHKSVDGLSFCSQKFHGRTAEPEDPSKTVFRYLSHPPNDAEYPGYLTQLMWYFRHMEPDLKEKLREIAVARVERATKLTKALY